MRSVPKVKYPIALDDDYTLFKTYNSTQSVLAKDILSTDETIEIVPRQRSELEVWAENGFVTIEKELIYYDKVEKNENDKIFKLCDCIRAIEGKASNYRIGTSVSSNVVAQNHNQLVKAILNIEETIGDISDLLKMGSEIMNSSSKNLMKSVLPVAETDKGFSASLHASLSNLLSCAPVGDDACPDVEFIANNLGSSIEFCLRIYGNYNSFVIDFGDGTSTSTQMSGVWGTGGSGTPKVTVYANNCCIIQEATSPDDVCEAPTLDDPSVPFVVHIPEVPQFPQFIPPKQICPGPLFNLPPIIMPEIDRCTPCPSQIVPSFNCPSVIISVIEACKTPQIIRVVTPCRISIVSLVGCEMPSQISLVGCCPPSIISLICPNLPCISFCEPPSFTCISFCEVPSFDCISFCGVPSFDVISFAPFPSVDKVSFTVHVDLSLSPICFCEPPSFACISFCEVPSFDRLSFAEPPSFDCISFCDTPRFDCISFCDVPSFDCISFCDVPRFDCVSFCTPPSFDCISFCTPPVFDCIRFCVPPVFQCISFCDPPRISVDWGTPPTVSCVVNIVCPSTSGTTQQAFAMTNMGFADDPVMPVTMNDLGIPHEIKLTVPKFPEIKHNIPKEIKLVGDIPNEIKYSGPTKITVEPAPNFPTEIKVVGIPDVLNVTGVPSTIKLLMPDDPYIKLLMPDDPTIELKYSGAPLELKASPDLEKLLSNIIVQPK